MNSIMQILGLNWAYLMIEDVVGGGGILLVAQNYKLAFNCWREYIHSATLQYLANSSYGATWSTLNLGELNGDNKCDLFCPFHVHRALL